MIRFPLFLGTVVVCLAAAPNGPPLAQTPAGVVVPTLLTRNELPAPEQFAELAKTDALGMLNASMSRYRNDVRGYTCTMLKQERVKGTLGPKEVIEVAFRDEPFAVFLKWTEGAGLASATLFAQGENKGNLKAKSFVGVTDSDPNGFMPRQSSRFSILDFGIYRGTLRTYAAWKRAQDRGTLKVEYLGTKPIPELNGRVCHVLRRTCEPTEVDNFSMTDTDVKSPDKYPKEAIRTATIMLDAETFLHVGSDIRGPNDVLLAAYYFRDLHMNPRFDREQFLPSILTK